MNIEFTEQNVEVIQDFTQEELTKRIEKIGRICYKSEHKICDGSDIAFLKKILKNGHSSVLEHINLTVKFITDRATANALERHRHTAISQESTHFIKYKNKGILTFVHQEDVRVQETFNSHAYKIFEEYLKALDYEESKISRALLPLGFKTELYMTTNLTQWRYMLKIRTQEKCHPQMRALMKMLLKWFKINYPLFVEDITL